jgi:hypothetical protein
MPLLEQQLAVGGVQLSAVLNQALAH